MKFWTTNIICTLVSCCLSLTLLAQQDIAIDNWRTHFPFNEVVSVTQSPTKVYYAASETVVIYDKEEGSVQRLDKVSGLSEVGIRLVKYYPERDILLVAYENGNLDLITEKGIVNIADLKRYTLIAEKIVHHIQFSGDIAYLSCSFGLVELDVERLEIKNTYFTNDFDVNASYIINDTIFMATDEGIFQGNPSPLLNLNDFSNWQLHAANKNLPNAYYSNVMEYFDGKLFADINDTIMTYTAGKWQHFASFNAGNDTNFPYFYNEQNYNRHLETASNGERMILTTNFIIAAIEKDGFYYPIGGGNPQQAIRDTETWYYASSQQGAMKMERFEFTSIQINAPAAKDMSHVTARNGQVWITSGGVNTAWQSLSNGQGLYSFVDGNWDFHNNNKNSGFAGVNDFIPVAIHPTTGVIYAGSYNKGLIEYDGTTVTKYGKYNSVLQSPPLDTFTVRITGLAFDNEENLWISNYESPRPIAVYRNDGTWESFAIPENYAQLADMIVDKNGYKWALVVRGSGGVVVFNENAAGSASNTYRILTTGNSELPSNDVHSLTMDRDGNVWIGTAEGTVVFECTSQLFTADGCSGRRVVVTEDDYGDHLFAKLIVTAIAVDGANRKWFGTNSGIFVQSPNAETTLLRFTTENSPLPSDEIIDIAINDETGEVFIATEQGLVSYRSDATKGGNTHADNVYAFPNPVRPEYEGKIAIRGLVEDANVKITDISGRLIYETTALGGQAIWDGRDYNGRKAATGVYLVFSTNQDGTQTLATKVAFIN